MTGAEKSIARYLILAQIASDAGKGIHRLHIEGDEKAHEMGYTLKEGYILKAIEIIRKIPNNFFRFYIEERPDQNGYASIIALFSWKIHGKRFQCSFHNPYGRASKALKSIIGSGRAEHWTGKGRQSSNNYLDSADCLNRLKQFISREG